MSSKNVHVVLLSGGSGTRLWPLSNAARSKQFLKVLRNDCGECESMVQRTFRLIREQVPEASITVATSASQVEPLRMQLEGDYALSVEPTRRDTAPAILLAASHLSSVQHADEDATVVIMPIDTFADAHYYASISALDAAVQSDCARLVLLGVEPTHPNSKYGYIVPSENSARELFRVSRFVEKPDEQLAQSLISQGALWNCGVFALRLSYLLELIHGYTTLDTYDELRAHYDELPKTSFDYAVVEHAESIAALPYRGTWEDLGTWNTLVGHLSEPISEGVWVDEETVHGVCAINETSLPVVIAGVRDAVVVVTPDGVLVTGTNDNPNIKGLVERTAYNTPHYECHTWGECAVLEDMPPVQSARAVVRRLTIHEGCNTPKTELEHGVLAWTVLFGSGTAVVNGKKTQLERGQTLQIQCGETYSVCAYEDMCLIESHIYGQS